MLTGVYDAGIAVIFDGTGEIPYSSDELAASSTVALGAGLLLLLLFVFVVVVAGLLPPGTCNDEVLAGTGGVYCNILGDSP